MQAGDPVGSERGPVDVRDLVPQRRHELILEAFDRLDTGERFLLVNDPDPKPLYHQFDAEAGPAFEWSYLDREPGDVRVRIGKAEGPSVDQASAQPATTA